MSFLAVTPSYTLELLFGLLCMHAVASSLVFNLKDEYSYHGALIYGLGVQLATGRLGYAVGHAAIAYVLRRSRLESWVIDYLLVLANLSWWTASVVKLW